MLSILGRRFAIRSKSDGCDGKRLGRALPVLGCDLDSARSGVCATAGAPTFRKTRNPELFPLGSHDKHEHTVVATILHMRDWTKATVVSEPILLYTKGTTRNTRAGLERDTRPNGSKPELLYQID